MSENKNDIILQFIDRIVDENIKSADSLANLKFNMKEQRQDVDEILKSLRNGLREDLKTHISTEMSKLNKEIEDLSSKCDKLIKENENHNKRNERIESFLSDIEKKGLLIRGVVLLVTNIAVIVSGMIYMTRIVNESDNTQETEQVVPEENTIDENKQP